MSGEESRTKAPLWWLALILGVGVGLRVWGLGFGLPLDLRPDERFYQEVVSGMVARGDLNPRLFAYPGLPFMMLLGTLRTAHGVAGMTGSEIGEQAFEDAVNDVVWVTRVQRGLSAALGSLTVLIVFFLGRALGGRGCGLVSAALLATCPLHVMHSHFGVVDVPATSFVSAALLAIVEATRGGRMRFVVAGLLAGLATAMRYLPAVLAASIVIAVLAARRREGNPRWWWPFDGRLALAGGAMIAGFLAGAPYTVLDFAGFREGFLEPFVSGTIGLGQRSAGETFAVYVGTALRHGLTLPVLVCVAVGVGAALGRVRGGGLALLLYVVLYGSLLLTARKMFFRYLVPLVPVFLVLAAGALAPVLAGIRRRFPWGSALLLGLLLAWPVISCVGSNRLLSQPSSFERLREYLEAPERQEESLAFTSSATAEILALPRRTVSLDLRALRERGGSFLLVATRHPHPMMPSPAGPLALVARDATPLAAQDVGALQDAVFEARDRWFHPYAGAYGLEANGPSWAVYRVDPRSLPPVAAPQQIRAAGLHVVAFAGQLAVSWKAAAGASPVGWIVRHLEVAEVARRQAEGRADLGDLPRVVVPGGERRAVIADPGPGRWIVIVSALSPDGEGPPSPSTATEIR